MTNPTRPPTHLSAEFRKLWRSVVGEYELERRHGSVLAATSGSHDRTRKARTIIDNECLNVRPRTAESYGRHRRPLPQGPAIARVPLAKLQREHVLTV